MTIASSPTCPESLPGPALAGVGSVFPSVLQGLRTLFADRTFRIVLLVWVVMCSSWVLYLRQAGSLPWGEDYAYVHFGIATREKPITWTFLWQPANDDRAPATRLWVALLGRVCHWNCRTMLQVDLALMAGGCLALLLAVRKARGRAHLGDTFLPLLLLAPSNYETLALTVHASAMALAVWCGTAALVLVKAQTRSLSWLLLYLSGAAVVAWGGGCAGAWWALGLCIPLAQGWLAPTSRAWKVGAVLGGLALVASSGILLWTLPPAPEWLQALRSTGNGMTLRASAEFAVGWVGSPALHTLYPWVLVPLGVCAVSFTVRFLKDAVHTRLATLVQWSDLAALFVAALTVTVGLARAWARYPDPWPSRFGALEVPLAVAGYLLLVRAAVPKTLLSGLAVGMAICVGWNIQVVRDLGSSLHPRQHALRASLHEGSKPLCIIAEEYSDATGWSRAQGFNRLITLWAHMRNSRTSVFRSGTPQRSLLWHPSQGALECWLGQVQDWQAVENLSIEARATGSGITAVYDVDIKTEGTYRLCCRCRAADPGPGFGLSLDNGPVTYHPVVPGGEYAPALSAGMHLDAGKHRLAVTWPGPWSRVDLFELTPE